MFSAPAVCQSSDGGAEYMCGSFGVRDEALNDDACECDTGLQVKRSTKDGTSYHTLSAALAQLATRISGIMKFGGGAGEDAFVKVKALPWTSSHTEQRNVEELRGKAAWEPASQTCILPLQRIG